MQIFRQSTKNNAPKLPKLKPLITIDCFTVSQDRYDDLLDDWNNLLLDFEDFENILSINLYQSFSQRKSWILQIEWKSEQDLKEALSYDDFEWFQKFLEKWDIATSQERQRYSPQIYRKFSGLNLNLSKFKPKFSWEISTNSIIIIAFVFGIAVALLILILR